MAARCKLFAGIELDDRARTQCAAVAQRMREANFPARYEEPQKLHVTLAFLGYVELEKVDAIAQALKRSSAQQRPFRLTLDKIGAFPSERRPRIVFVGARDQAAFREAANDVRAAFAALGFTFDIGPVAHVTIARSKADAPHLPLLDVAPIDVDVRAFALFESLPHAKTTRYEVRSRADLGR